MVGTSGHTPADLAAIDLWRRTGSVRCSSWPGLNNEILHGLQALGALTAHLRRVIQWSCPELQFNSCALFS